MAYQVQRTLHAPKGHPFENMADAAQEAEYLHAETGAMHVVVALDSAQGCTQGEVVYRSKALSNSACPLSEEPAARRLKHMTQPIIINGFSVHLLPGTTLELHDLPPRGVALDGCIRGPHSTARDQWSFDHHDNCMRLITKATCEQVHAVLALGGPTWFAGRSLYINDLDGDTLLSLWLLCEAPALTTVKDRVTTLVRAVGAVDAHGPSGFSLLCADEVVLAKAFYATAIAPVTNLRGRVREVFDQWPALIAQCFAGITALVQSKITDLAPAADDSRLPLYNIKTAALGPSVTAMMAECEGFGFEQAYATGARLVVLHRAAADGSRTYTIAKASDLVAVNVGPASDATSILGRLAALEPGWGGGSSIGGSPRLEGGVSSRLSPEAVWAVILGDGTWTAVGS